MPKTSRLHAYHWFLAAFLLAAMISRGLAQEEHSSDAQDYEEPARRFQKLHDQAAAAYEAGKLEEALAGFTAALQLNPESSLAHYNRGTVLLRQRQLAAAVKDFTAALSLDRHAHLAYMNRGVALSELGRLDDALRDLDEAVRLAPRNADGLFNRSIVHARRRAFDAAVRDYEAVIALDLGDRSPREAGSRLKLLLNRQNKVHGGPPELSAEVVHARRLEDLLRVVEESCLAHGQDRETLDAFARQKQWEPAAAVDFPARRTGRLKALAAWRVSNSTGSYTIVQSAPADEPRLMVCSVVADWRSPHLFSDLRSVFEAKFNAVAQDVSASRQQMAAYYRLRFGGNRIETSLNFTARASRLSVRVLHAR